MHRLLTAALWFACGHAAAAGAPPSCVGSPGRWIDNDVAGNDANLTWRYDMECSLAISSIDDARRKLPNHTIYFVGDSTMRGSMNDIALWLHGCPTRSLNGRLRRRLQDGSAQSPERMRCDIVATKAWGHWFATIPFSDGSHINIGFRSLTYARNAIGDADLWWPSLVLAGRDPPTDGGGAYAPGSLTVVVSAGHWNLRFDGKRDSLGLQSMDDIRANYLYEVAVMIANASSVPSTRDRLLWRSTLPIDRARPSIEDGALNASAVEWSNEVVTGMWRAAGYGVVDLFKFGANVANATKGSSALRFDGIHYKPWVHAPAMTLEVLSLVYEKHHDMARSSGPLTIPVLSPIRTRSLSASPSPTPTATASGTGSQADRSSSSSAAPATSTAAVGSSSSRTQSPAEKPSSTGRATTSATTSLRGSAAPLGVVEHASAWLDAYGARGFARDAWGAEQWDAGRTVGVLMLVGLAVVARRRRSAAGRVGYSPVATAAA